MNWKDMVELIATTAIAVSAFCAAITLLAVYARCIA